MSAKQNEYAARLYFILAACFISALVTCNLIFQKFFFWQPFSFLGDNTVGNFTFQISAGILPYPITFLVTDIISEIFGQKRANDVVKAGLVATVFTLAIVYTANAVPATDWSPVDDATFTTVFGNTFIGIAASMVAYLLAQFIDIRVFHFWKRLTKGKMLWVRNNFSTMASQAADTGTVLLLLCGFGAIDWDMFWVLFFNGFLFKVLVAACDTPLFYLAIWFFKKRLKLSENQEARPF